MIKKFTVVAVLAAAVGLTAVAVPALAQQPATDSTDDAVTCPYHDSATMSYDEMEQWMGADHGQVHAEMYAEMSEHMGNFGSMPGYGSMMGGGMGMMGYRSVGE